MKVLVFNCGSSSLKYRLLDMPDGVEAAGGEAQRIGPATAEPARLIHRSDGNEEIRTVDMPDHSAAFGEVIRTLGRDGRLVPDVVAHRLVHGGERFTGPVRINAAVLRDLDAISDLAPLHNPPAMRLIHACHEQYPDLPQAAVFDTAFHATIPDYAQTYAIPLRLRRDLGIRKYGFHGTSHQYVMEEAAAMLGIPPAHLNAVSCHLGSGGASLCAIVGGRSVDNSMGFSPLQGLVMSTRSGDVDPAVAMNLLTRAAGDAHRVGTLLNKRSGVLGMSGLSSDIRDILSRRGASRGETERLDLTARVYLWRIRKYLGAYLAVTGPADAVIFTDTVGESVPAVREAVTRGLEVFGLVLSPDRNRRPGRLPADVAAKESAVRILIIPTNEELAIARRTVELFARAA